MSKILINLPKVIKNLILLRLNLLCSLVIPLFLSSCSFNKSYNFDKLNKYEPKLQESFYKKENLNPPYIALFRENRKILLYVATKHETNSESHSFKLINQAFEKYKPDFLVIEGVASKFGESPKGLIDHINICMKDSTCGENI